MVPIVENTPPAAPVPEPEPATPVPEPEPAAPVPEPEQAAPEIRVSGLVLFDGDNCDGESYNLNAGTYTTDDLLSIGWNDRPSSIRLEPGSLVEMW